MFTLSKIAKLANVSVSTASKAFSMSPEVNEETRQMIFEVAKENGCFKKFFNAKYPKLVVAVICPEFESLYYTSILSRLQMALEKCDSEICVATTQFSKERARSLIEYYSRYTSVDGVILIDTPRISDADCDIPTVYIGNADESAVRVTVSKPDAIEAAVEHFISSGVREIGFLGERLTSSKQRVFCQAVEKRLGSYNEDYVAVGGRFFDGGYNTMLSLIKKGKVPRAIICAYDYLAIGAMRCLSDNGYRVPEDVAILGMDDIPEAKYLTPPLSSISSNITEVCKAAADTLINMLMGKPYEKNTVIKATLHLRRSSEIGDT